MSTRQSINTRLEQLMKNARETDAYLNETIRIIGLAKQEKKENK